MDLLYNKSTTIERVKFELNEESNNLTAECGLLTVTVILLDWETVNYGNQEYPPRYGR